MICNSAPMLALRSLTFNVSFFIWTLILCVLCLPIFALSRQTATKAAAFWVTGALLMLRIFCGIKTEIRGIEHMKQSGVIYACKHQSAWETMVFWLLLEQPAFILKRELTRIPLFGQYLMKVGNIAINRSAGNRALKVMQMKAKHAMDRGQPIVIFPEGTRTSPGHTRKYLPGVAALYTELNVPVIPVALNSGQHWGKRSFIKRPGTIIMEFLPPVYPGMESRSFLKHLQEQIETASNALLTRRPIPVPVPEAAHPSNAVQGS